jgi:hypothetical protein
MCKSLRFAGPLILGWSLLLHSAPASNAQTSGVYFGVETSTGNDTLELGEAARIQFTVFDPNGRYLVALVYALTYSFSHGNIIGSLAPGVSVFPTAESSNLEVFHWAEQFQNATNPDTTLCARLTFRGGVLRATDSVPVWYIQFVPIDTGTILIDTVFIPPGYSTSAHDVNAQWFPVYWQPKTITVVHSCPVELTGELTGDGKITAADIIRAVCFGFACDPATPCESATADVNCDGTLTVADMIYLVNYTFKNGPPPCNVCPLIWDGTWPCD